jgi:hypothetical protein
MRIKGHQEGSKCAGLGPWLSRFIVRLNMLFSCKKYNSVSAQFWPYNRRFFTKKNAHKLFLNFYLVGSTFPIHGQTIRCAITIHEKSISYFTDFFLFRPSVYV